MLRPILGENLTKYFSSCSDFNGPRLYFESKGDHTRIWLALAEAVNVLTVAGK